jgi:hypothetical protein
MSQFKFSIRGVFRFFYEKLGPLKRLIKSHIRYSVYTILDRVLSWHRHFFWKDKGEYSDRYPLAIWHVRITRKVNRLRLDADGKRHMFFAKHYLAAAWNRNVYNVRTREDAEALRRWKQEKRAA